MKQKTYGILTAVLSVILICTLGIRILIPMAGASEPDTPQLGDVYRNGDYTGYFGLSQDIPRRERIGGKAGGRRPGPCG